MNSTLLRPVPAEGINRLLKDGSARITEYRTDTVVHFEGDHCAGLDIILKGRISLERIDASGKVFSVGDFHEGDVLGGNLLFSRNPVYPMTAVTCENTIIATIKKDALFMLLSENPDFLLTYLEFVSDNANILGEKIRYDMKKPIRDCMLDFLRTERHNQKSKHIRLNITKKALAERFGVQRTSLSRELARMKKDGIILYDAKSITVLGPL
jgi:CRP-like cAMP-binding protein